MGNEDKEIKSFVRLVRKLISQGKLTIKKNNANARRYTSLY